MERITEQILDNLHTEKFVTAAELAATTGVSEKTVRTRLKELTAELRRHGAELTAKPRTGYRLRVTDPDTYDAWRLREKSGAEVMPSTSEDRVQFLLTYLLNHTEYIKLEDLTQILYVSRNTLTADLKRVEYILEMYHLTIHRRPNYGICVRGREFDRRLCIANCLMKRKRMGTDTSGQAAEKRAVAEMVRATLRTCKLEMSEGSFESLVIHICVALERLRHNHTVEVPDETGQNVSGIVGQRAMEAAKMMAQSIEEYSGRAFPEGEVYHLAIHISGKSVSGSHGKYGFNLVISSQIDELVLMMLAAVYEGVRLDFRDNLELRMSLNQHMVPFDIRMRYDIPMKNPMLAQIKREYTFAYTVAATACTVLNRHYGREVPEDEVGYFAVLFALALEKQGKEISTKNVVVVCVSGRGSSQLFLYKYRQAFGKYINKIYESTVYDLEYFDFAGKKIDYVFTTVPINISLPVPVFEVSLFLDHQEMDSYRRLFEMGDDAFLKRYFDADLFVADLKAKTKEEVLAYMCRYAARYRQLPEDFYEAVWQREEMGQTDFGNLVAIPHPNRILPGEQFVMVSVLEQPVWWGHNDVQVVLLIFLSKEADADLEKFYQAVTSFLADAGAVQRLIQKPTFDTLIRELRGRTGDN